MERILLLWIGLLVVGLCSCFVHGSYIAYQASTLRDYDQHWTEWSRWSECSRTCGGGASYQTRGCQVGQMCEGRTIRYKTCNTQDCPSQELDFRSQQCAAYNDEKFENRTIEWEPVEALLPEEQCSLICSVRHHNFTKMLAPKVLDGTRCNRYTVDMCIAGKCEPVGCDYQFNSSAQFDRCGVCNGDNTTCELVKGRKVVAGRQSGLQDVLQIPAGSHTIKLSSKDRGSSLGFRTLSGSTGINQWALANEEGTYWFGGALALFRRFRSGREQILIDGTIKEDVIVTVFVRDSGSSREKVHYQYLAPLTHVWTVGGWSRCNATCGGGQESSTLDCTNVATGAAVADSRCEGQKPEIKTRVCNVIDCPSRWEPQPWGECTLSCGTGTQTRELYCVQKISNGMTIRLSDDLCSGTRPPSVQTCNSDACPYWKPEAWSECSVSCGQGVSRREIQCRNHRNHMVFGCNPETMPSDRKICVPGVPCLPDPVTDTPKVVRPDVASASPHEQAVESPEEELPSYHASEWSPCSTTCGVGIRTRSVRCKVYMAAFDSTFDLNDFDCHGIVRPHEVEECHAATACPLPPEGSLYGSAGAVSPLGGGGDNGGVDQVPTDPNVFHPDPTLNVGPGPDQQAFNWRYWDFTPCSASCVGGVQESVVRCFNAFTNEVVSDAHCDYSLKLPSSQRACNEVPCPPEWKVLLYSDCSETCGRGIKFPLDFLCVQLTARTEESSLVTLDESECWDPKPNDPLYCEARECPAVWVIGEWSECSALCGHGPGNKTRPLYCQGTDPLTGQQERVDFTRCPLPVPHTVEECDNFACPPYWLTRPASECSVSCGKGTQSVTLSCHQLIPIGGEIELDPQLCPIPAPPTTQPCSQLDCPADWLSQTLSECSATCGVGVKLQSVLCGRILANGTRVYIDPSQCHPDSRPADRVTCDLPKCPDVHILANYSSFRQTDETSSKVRVTVGQEAVVFAATTVTIKCPVVNFKRSQVVWERGTTPIRANAQDSARVKVMAGGVLRIKHAAVGDSGVYACRAGDQRETLTLDVRPGKEVNPRINPSPGSPTLEPGASVRWHMGQWTNCTAGCGGGMQTRLVRCLHPSWSRRSGSRGNTGPCKGLGLEEPVSMRACNMHPCRNHWSADTWSQCSGDCVGVRQSLQTREVVCRSPSLAPLGEEMCPPASKPDADRVCPNLECSPKWLVTKWSSCSSSCGVNAVQRRRIRCVTKNTRKKMDNLICGAVFGQPPVMKKCLLDPCPGDECQDEGTYCSLVHRLNMCNNPSFQRRCCKTCLSYG